MADKTEVHKSKLACSKAHNLLVSQVGLKSTFLIPKPVPSMTTRCLSVFQKFERTERTRVCRLKNTTPRMSQSSTCDCYCIWIKGALKTRLSILRWGDYPGLCGWDQWSHSGHCEKDIGIREAYDVIMRTEIRLMCLHERGRGPQGKAYRWLQKLEKVENRFLLRASRKKSH